MRRRLEIFLYLLSILVLAATVSYYMIPSRTMHETIYDAIEPSGLTATESTAHKTQERLLYDTEYGNLARGGDACIMAKSFLEGIFSVGYRRAAGDYRQYVAASRDVCYGTTIFHIGKDYGYDAFIETWACALVEARAELEASFEPLYEIEEGSTKTVINGDLTILVHTAETLDPLTDFWDLEDDILAGGKIEIPCGIRMVLDQNKNEWKLAEFQDCYILPDGQNACLKCRRFYFKNS